MKMNLAIRIIYIYNIIVILIIQSLFHQCSLEFLDYIQTQLRLVDV